MFDDIELTVGEVLPTASIGTDAQIGTYYTCTDLCSCMSQCCRTTNTCC